MLHYAPLNTKSSFLLTLCWRRVQEPEPSADHRAQDVRAQREPRRLPALSDDVRQLPEAAGLL